MQSACNSSPQIHQCLANESEFRLVVLLPSLDFDSQLECRLEHAVLGACKPYEALSYVWGSPDFTKQIVLDEKEFMITPSLESALRHLRLPEEERTLWIDAICINQQDLAERREQVGYMRQIYGNCSSDVLWFGPAHDRNVRGMEIIKKLQGFNLGQIESLGWRRSQVVIGTGSRPGNSSGLSYNWQVDHRDFWAIGHLLRDNPVWKRVWIMQEISCAPKVILACGNEMLDWSPVEAILDGVHYSADAFHASFSHELPKPLASLFGNARFISTQREIMSKLPSDGESALLDVLARFKQTLSTDPRDKVYGLLGLVSDTLGVEADYTKSAQETYTGVALALINSSGTLDLICQSSWQRPSVQREWRLEGLPDWVPDFNNPNQGEFLFAQRNIYSPGRPKCSVPVVVQGSGTVLLNGVILDHLNAFSEAERCEPETKKLVLHGEWQKIIRDWGRKYLSMCTSNNNERLEYRTGESQVQAFWRTLVGDCKGYPTERLTPEDIAHDQSIVQEILAQEAPTRHVDKMRSFKILEKLLSNSWRFRLSVNGLFMLAQCDTAEGDVVVILDGAKTPMVLRPTEQDSGANILYRPISGAYVHGFMDGEVLEQKGGFEERVFRVI